MFVLLSAAKINFDEILGIKIGDLSLERILMAVIVFAVCLVLKKIIMRVMDRAFHKEGVDPGLRKFLTTAAKILIYAVIVMLVVGALGIPITSLVTVFSVVGVAVSLAIQSTLSNVAGGIMVIAARPFKVGDYIEAADCAGTVKEIGIAYSKLVTSDNKMIVIPNKDISAGKITNYSSEKIRRIDSTYGAPYDADPETVKKALVTAAGRLEKALTNPLPSAGIFAYRTAGIEYGVKVWVSNERYESLNMLLNEEVGRVFQEEGIPLTALSSVREISVILP